jgi:hypothetical protein
LIGAQSEAGGGDADQGSAEQKDCFPSPERRSKPMTRNSGSGKTGHQQPFAVQYFVVSPPP